MNDGLSNMTTNPSRKISFNEEVVLSSMLKQENSQLKKEVYQRRLFKKVDNLM